MCQASLISTTHLNQPFPFPSSHNICRVLPNLLWNSLIFKNHFWKAIKPRNMTMWATSSYFTSDDTGSFHFQTSPTLKEVKRRGRGTGGGEGDRNVKSWKKAGISSPPISHNPRSCEMHWREQRSCPTLLTGRGFLCFHRFKRERGEVELLWINPHPPGKERRLCRSVGSTHLGTFTHGWLGKVLAQRLARAPQTLLKPHLGWSLQTESASPAQGGFWAAWGALATLMDAKTKNKSDLRH